MFQVLLYEVLLKKPERIVSPDGWPSMVIAYRMYEWFPILILATVIEMALIRSLLHINWIEALKASAAANAVSSLCGFIFLPLMGGVWGYTLMETFQTLSETYGHFTLASWMGNALYMSIFLGLVEIPLISGVTKEGVTRNFIILWMFANLITIGLVLLTFYVQSPQIGVL